MPGLASIGLSQCPGARRCLLEKRRRSPCVMLFRQFNHSRSASSANTPKNLSISNRIMTSNIMRQPSARQFVASIPDERLSDPNWAIAFDAARKPVQKFEDELAALQQLHSSASPKTSRSQGWRSRGKWINWKLRSAHFWSTRERRAGGKQPGSVNSQRPQQTQVCPGRRQWRARAWKGGGQFDR